MSCRSCYIFKATRAIIFSLSLLFSVVSTVVLIWMLSREFSVYSKTQKWTVIGSIINGCVSIVLDYSMLAVPFSMRSDARRLIFFFVSALGNTVSLVIFGRDLPCGSAGSLCRPLIWFIIFGWCTLLALASFYTILLSLMFLRLHHQQHTVSMLTVEKGYSASSSLDLLSNSTDKPSYHSACFPKAAKNVAGAITTKLRPERPVSTTSSWEVPFRPLSLPPASPASSYRRLRAPSPSVPEESAHFTPPGLRRAFSDRSDIASRPSYFVRSRNQASVPFQRSPAMYKGNLTPLPPSYSPPMRPSHPFHAYVPSRSPPSPPAAVGRANYSNQTNSNRLAGNVTPPTPTRDWRRVPYRTVTSPRLESDRRLI